MAENRAYTNFMPSIWMEGASARLETVQIFLMAGSLIAGRLVVKIDRNGKIEKTRCIHDSSVEEDA